MKLIKRLGLAAWALLRYLFTGRVCSRKQQAAVDAYYAGRPGRQSRV